MDGLGLVAQSTLLLCRLWTVPQCRHRCPGNTVVQCSRQSSERGLQSGDLHSNSTTCPSSLMGATYDNGYRCCRKCCDTCQSRITR
ncbi:hypothetical protein Moror_11320 [Moniliophthora roreri MCA 2997]|uniref:Secreted protein n=1 Tax=Moniliophthora roreri (strain MCA 2997) TaxID=1381753 RepID=V2WYP0_MONRO|nr:hypothetical protein Moror_11320 [Moniliophthora roreri MCA 2997]